MELNVAIQAKADKDYDTLLPVTNASLALMGDSINQDNNIAKQLDKINDEILRPSIYEFIGTVHSSESGLFELISLDGDDESNSNRYLYETLDFFKVTFIATVDFTSRVIYMLANKTSESYNFKIKNMEQRPLSDGAWKAGATVTLSFKKVSEGNYEAFYKEGSIANSLQTLPPQVINLTSKQEGTGIRVSFTVLPSPYYRTLQMRMKEGSPVQDLNDGKQVLMLSSSKWEVGFDYDTLVSDYKGVPFEYGKTYYFRVFPENKQNQYQTQYVSTSTTMEEFQLPTYTGQYTIFGDETEGRIEMYTSGTLTLSESNYDLFCVGGGGGTMEKYAFAGGGGGYTNTKNLDMNAQSYDVTIGSGGTYSRGGTTSIGTLIVGSGGFSNARTRNDGGSGGGAGGSGSEYIAGDGGSDGGDGSPATSANGAYVTGGTGQYTTTRAFGESTGTLYSGGGGGFGGFKNSTAGSGGAGGGGNGGSERYPAQDGTPNTGGGAGGGGIESVKGTQGGSGIAIVRWKR